MRSILVAPVLLTAVLGLAEAQSSDRLVPRVPLAKAPVKAPSVGASFVPVVGPRYRLVVKFRDDVRARAEAGGVVSLAGADLAQVHQLAEESRTTFSPLIGLPTAEVAALEARAAERSGRQQPDLLGLLVVDLPGGLGMAGGEARDLERAGEALQALDVVEYAHIEALGPPPPFDIPPTTPSYQHLQTYFGPNPGMDVDYAWSLGFRGAGVRLTDVEYNWLATHEDLNEVDLHPELDQTPSLTGGYQDHGTAVVGAIAGQPNAYGVRGMAADAMIATYSEWTVQQPGRRVAAVTHAIADSGPGDIVLLEMQYGYLGANRLGPAELDPNIWLVTRVGTDAGVTVVAAAGNGDENLDAAEYAFYRDRGDSGAIIVGAGSANTGHHKLSFSTYGSRVNVQGWGESVVTLCCGTLAQIGGDPNQFYSSTFNGTSSASPFVASAAAILQQAARARTGEPLAPEDLRQLLIDTGIPQGAGGHIGPLPSLRAALGGVQPRPSVFWRSAGPLPVGESVPTIATDVLLSVPGGGPTTQTVRVRYETVFGTARGGEDYTSETGFVTFPPGSSDGDARPVDVSVLGDALDEPDETFSIRLSNPEGADLGTPDTVQVVIRDDDDPPALSVGDCAATEGDGANVPCRFTLSLSGPSGRVVTVRYESAPGTAASNVDFVPVGDQMVFPPGATVRTVDVPVVGDLMDEPAETFSLRLSAPTNATLADDVGQGTIQDNDPPPTLSIRDVRASDRNFGTVAYFTVALSTPSGFPISVGYATADGSATAGVDYVGRSGSLSFPPGTSKRAIGVPIVQDVRDEGTETFGVGLSGAVNATIFDGAGEATLVERSTPAPCAGRLDPLDDQTGLPVDLLVSEVDPGDHVELYNPTPVPLALEGTHHHLATPRQSVGVAALGGSIVVPAHGYALLPWPTEFTLTDQRGELILYRDREVDDPTHMVDFACWGATSAASRKDQAEAVGKWAGSCAPALADRAIHRLAFTKGTLAGDYDTTSPPSPQTCAASFKVTRADDLGDGVCDGECSLRDAVAAANAAPGHDTILLAALEGNTAYAIGPSGGLSIAGGTDVVGEGARSTIVDGGAHGRIFEVAAGAFVSIRGLTLRNGTTDGDGGAITSAGQLTLVDSALRGNAARDGGAIAVTDGKAVLRGVTLSENAASGDGGALSAACSGCGVTLINVTMSGNRANGHGGALHHEGARITLRSSTVTANRANADGDSLGLGGGVAGTGLTTLGNTLLAGNTALAGTTVAPSDCTDDCGCIVSEGYNLVGTNAACPFPPTIGDLVGSPGPLDPRVGPLANNHGPADTHALLAGGPAIDSAQPATTGPLACPATDERSYRRPQDGDANQSARCDRGAFELCPLPFSDVPSSLPIAPFVAELYCRGIASGCGGAPPRFCPTDSVTREQMAVFLVGALGEQPSGAVHDAYFQDVPDDAFAGYINRLHELGITAGCAAGSYCPGLVVSRKAMAVFLVVAMEEGRSDAPYDAYFTDLADDGFAPYVNRLFELGITGGCGAGAFCPDAAVTRGDMAVFLGVGFFRY